MSCCCGVVVWSYLTVVCAGLSYAAGSWRRKTSGGQLVKVILTTPINDQFPDVSVSRFVKTKYMSNVGQEVVNNGLKCSI